VSDPNIFPFEYPDGTHSLRHGPAGYRNYQSFRPWLRDEFDFRCAYCLFREGWCRILSFQLDHFVPQIREPQRATTYSNLIYACPTCNLGKSKKPLPAPLSHMRRESVTVHEDGTIEGHTNEARRTIRVLGLDSLEHVAWRRQMIENIELAWAAQQAGKSDLYREMMGYPAELPDLAHLKAPSNSRPEGVHESAFARRERGALPDVY
jgi:hypothetical protein